MAPFWKSIKLRVRASRLFSRSKESAAKPSGPDQSTATATPVVTGPEKQQATPVAEETGIPESAGSGTMAGTRLDGDDVRIQVWNVKEPWIDVKCELGEGPYYEQDTHSIRFVDIFGKKIYWVDLAKGPSSLRSIDVEDFVGVTADIHGVSDKIIVAAKFGYALVDKSTGAMEYVRKTWDDSQDGEGKVERMRFNDGAIDPRGRFWAGSMTDNSKYKVEAEGALFRLEVADTAALSAANGQTLARPISPVSIPNGIGWAADGRTMFFTDSPTRTIWAFDYDLATGAATNRRPWFELRGSIRIPKSGEGAEGEGGFEEFTFDDSMVPDGFQIDAHGNLWTAVWGGSMVLRLEDRGERRIVTGVVRVPSRCSTCPRFVKGGGMFITSASEEEPEVYGDGGPGAGKVFWVDVGVEGCETFKFGKPLA